MSASATQLQESSSEIASHAQAVVSETNEMQNIVNEGRSSAEDSLQGMTHILDAVQKTSAKVNESVQATSDIRTVLELITSIAARTNLLALNATIEAASAGEAGKGFAVVANEVKELANQTSSSIKGIQEKIKNLVNNIESIENYIREVEETVNKGSDSVKKTDVLMSQVSETSSKIADSMQQVSATLQSGHEITKNVEKTAQEVKTQAEQGLHQIELTLDAMDTAEKLLVGKLQGFVGQEIPHLTVLLAKSDHIIWKKRLANMLVGRENLNPEQLASHHDCRLGKWYYSLEDSSIKASAAFTELEAVHALAHEHGIEASRLYQQGDLVGAIEEVQKVEQASIDVIRYLDELIMN